MTDCSLILAGDGKCDDGMFLKRIILTDSYRSNIIHYLTLIRVFFLRAFRPLAHALTFTLTPHPPRCCRTERGRFPGGTTGQYDVNMMHVPDTHTDVFSHYSWLPFALTVAIPVLSPSLSHPPSHPHRPSHLHLHPPSHALNFTISPSLAFTHSLTHSLTYSLSPSPDVL